MARSSGISFVAQVVTWIFCAMFLVKGADCLMCYQCATSSASGPTAGCISDYGRMLDTARGDDVLYAKNCTETNEIWDKCMIQTAETNGQYVLYLRDCHDGLTFSHEFKSARFDKIMPNNQTTCSRVNGTEKFVCFQFCNTDYCNGPQVPEKEPTICELNEADPYDVTLPPNANCSGTVGIHASWNRPMGLQWLGAAASSMFVILASFSLT